MVEVILDLIIVAVTLGVYEVRLELTFPVLVPFAIIINHSPLIIIEAIAMHIILLYIHNSLISIALTMG